MAVNLVGAAEVAGILGVTRQRVAQLATSVPGFPAPVAQLAAGRIWDRADIERWAAANQERGPRRTAPEQMPPGRWPPHVARIVELASSEARALNHGWVGVQHILFALLHSASPGRARDVLESFGLQLEAARRQVVDSMGEPFSNPAPMQSVPPGTQLLLERANLKALALSDSEVDSEHVLLALADEWERRGFHEFFKISQSDLIQRTVALAEGAWDGPESIPVERGDASIGTGTPLILAPTPEGRDPYTRQPWGSRFLSDANGAPTGRCVQYVVDRDGHPVMTPQGKFVQVVRGEDGRPAVDRAGHVILVPIDIPSASVPEVPKDEA